jgi:2-polyprenyl-3-methyl-5-hydroxy-6-metoxy-1,4-benzoquinol methylase
MTKFDRKSHWEKIYQTKELEEVSWYQPSPITSLAFIEKAELSKEAKIIDIGGGDSMLVDHLLERGYHNITVLDISAAAIDRAKARLGAASGLVNWVVSDVVDFEPTEIYDFWHDRAAFHFLTDLPEIEAYMLKANEALKSDGKMLIGTFSEDGPNKCSGITIKQYSEGSMAKQFQEYFNRINCSYEVHYTPNGSTQNFLFCIFSRKPSA